jgi:hypothetical protein
MLGVLLAAGQSLGEVLDGMTFQQGFLAAEAITLAKAKALDAVMGPVTKQVGGEYKKTKLAPPGKEPARDGLTQAQKKDIQRMHRMAALGIRVRDERA